MTQLLFLPWMQHFIARMPSGYFADPPSDSLPSLLLLDNHSSRLSAEALQLALSHNIKVFGLLANSTHFMQPCDQHVNSRFKAGWRNAVADGQLDRLDSEKPSLPPRPVGSYIAAGHTQITADTVRASWRDTFLFPLQMDELRLHRRAVPVRTPLASLPESSAAAAVAPSPPAKKARKQMQPRSSGRVLTDPAFLAEMAIYSTAQQQASHKRTATLLRQLAAETAKLQPLPTSSAAAAAEAPIVTSEADKENAPPSLAAGRPVRERKRPAALADEEYTLGDSD